MDIGTDTIVYIVLGVLFVLAQISRRKKRSQASEKEFREVQAEPLTEVVEEPDEEPSAWDQFWNSTESDDQVDEPIFAPSVPPEYSHTLSSDEKDEKVENMLMADEKIREEFLFEGDLTKETEVASGQMTITDRFDLRKAIIYSTILERKYVS